MVQTSYDIIKAHRGIESGNDRNGGAEFIINVPFTHKAY